MLIDSHCHLDYFEPEERPGLVQRAAEAGVGELVTIGTRLGQSEELRTMADALGVWCTVGVHPHNAGEEPVAPAERIAALADHPRVIGIGESGLDYHYDTAPPEAQQASFLVNLSGLDRRDLVAAEALAHDVQPASGSGGAKLL